MSKQQVLIVCRGNIARSPFAEIIIRQELVRRDLESSVDVVSRGTQGTPVDPRRAKFPNITYYTDLYKDSKPALDKFGVNSEMARHVSKSVTQADTERASIIFAMDERTKNCLDILFPEQISKIHLMSELIGQQSDITDPETVDGVHTQDKIFTELRETIITGFPQLLKLLRSA